MGGRVVGLVEASFACAILGENGGVQLQTWKSHTRKWVVVLSGTHVRVCDFGEIGGVQLQTWKSHTRKWVVVLLY